MKTTLYPGQIIEDTYTSVKSYWYNFSDSINAAEANVKNVCSSVSAGESKYYGGTFKNAIRLAREGWPEGAKHVDSIITGLNISGRIAKPEIFFDVTGESGFDAGRIATGEPECMMEWRSSAKQTQTSKKPRILRILLNRASSDGIESTAACNRGGAILGLIEALELSGRSVELWTVDACKLGSKQCDIYIQVKAAGEKLSIDKIVFATMHVSYERRIAFSLIGTQGPTGAYNAKIGNMGMPCTALDAPLFDVYFDKMHFLERHIWNDKEKTIQWAKNKLAEMGVELK